MRTIIINAKAGEKPRIRQVMLNSNRVAYIAYRRQMDFIIHSTVCMTPERSFNHLTHISAVTNTIVSGNEPKFGRLWAISERLRRLDKFDPWEITKSESAGIYFQVMQP